jgi:hypothetical protein
MKVKELIELLSVMNGELEVKTFSKIAGYVPLESSEVSYTVEYEEVGFIVIGE